MSGPDRAAGQGQGSATARDRAGGGEIRLRPIGWLETPFRRLADCPRNGRQPDPAPLCTAVVHADLVEGLRDLDGFSHLILLYWLGTGPDATRLRLQLRLRPPFDGAEHGAERGVFARRAPCRPNPAGLSVVRFEGFAAPDRLRVRYLDCLDGTPLLGIKPYLPTTDCEPDAAMGWLAPHAAARSGCG